MFAAQLLAFVAAFAASTASNVAAPDAVTPTSSATPAVVPAQLPQVEQLLKDVPAAADVADGGSSKSQTVQLHRQRVPVKSPNGDITYKSVYFGTIYIGAPTPQKFSVVFDTGSAHLIVPAESCQKPTCRAHRRYDQRLSTGPPAALDIDYDGTVVPVGGDRDQITIAFGTGEVTGEFVQDHVCLGTVDRVFEDGGQVDDECIKLRVVSATEMTDDPFQAFAFDGVLGLSLASLAMAPEFNVFDSMVAQNIVSQDHFGVFLGDHNDEPSEICFGGHNEERIDSEISWAPVTMPEMGYWQVKITDILVGNRSLDFCKDGTCRAVVDTGTSLLAVPKIFYSDLHAELMQGQPAEPLAVNDCSESGLTSLSFVLDGMAIHLEGADYSRMSGNKCRPALMPIELPEPLGPKLFIMGEPVLRKFYTIYSWKKQQIGFAKAKHTAAPQSDSSNIV